jgi:diacylglycerol kinase (ATP)
LTTAWGAAVRIDLIINAKAPEALEELRVAVGELRGAGYEVCPRVTFEGGDARCFASEAAAAGAALVIAAGGDGTINEVANGLYDHSEASASGDTVGEAPRLGLVPLGTANDLAHTLGIPTEIAAAIRTAVEGEPLRINVGRVNGRCFLNVSTGGFGAEATGAADAGAKRSFGTLAYLFEAIKRFAALEPASATFRAGEVLYDGPFLIFAVGNSRRTGGGTEITPRAEVGDGLLDLCIVKEVSRVEFLGLLPDLRAGEHLEHPAVIYRQVRSLEVSAEVELFVNADGEPMRDRCFRYDVSPYPATVMVPSARRALRGAEESGEGG